MLTYQWKLCIRTSLSLTHRSVEANEVCVATEHKPMVSRGLMHHLNLENLARVTYYYYMYVLLSTLPSNNWICISSSSSGGSRSRNSSCNTAVVITVQGIVTQIHHRFTHSYHKKHKHQIKLKIVSPSKVKRQVHRAWVLPWTLPSPPTLHSQQWVCGRGRDSDPQQQRESPLRWLGQRAENQLPDL